MAVSHQALTTTFGGTKKALLAIAALLALYFAYEQVFPYFVWSEEAYGYYWQFRLPLLLHILGGLIALLCGVFQLWSGLNRRAMSTHPLTGRLYATAVAVGAAGGIWLSITSALFGFAWSVALFVLATAWLATTATAIYLIRTRQVVAHQQWMVRSYIVTFAFVLFRIVTDHIPAQELWGINYADWSNAMIWPVWVVPLLCYEILLALRPR
jgi:uncharacterized membrane protein